MEELEEYYRDALATFTRFNQGDWLEWMAGALNNNPREPVIEFPRAGEINTLFWVFNNLSENKTPLYQAALDKYCLSIVKYLEIIPPLTDNYSIIFTLIHFINDTRPFVCRRAIENIIRKGTFERCIYNQVNLNYFLIKAYTPIEDSIAKPLAPFLDKKLAVKPQPYFFYVYFHYQYKYFNLVRALEKLCEFPQQLDSKAAMEVTIALKEIVVIAKSFAHVNESLAVVLLSAEEPIPVEMDRLLSFYEGVMEYILTKYDGDSFEDLEESIKLTERIRQKILRQYNNISRDQLALDAGSVGADTNLSPAIEIYGSDTKLLSLVYD
jgi:hypothetical protein